MTVSVDHITIPARDKVAAMNWMAELLGVEAGPVAEPFAVVELDGCTLDYVERDEIQSQHVALRLDDAAFDAVYHRALESGVEIFGHPQSPENPANGQIDYHNEGRGFYFEDPNGHMMEIKTTRDDLSRQDGYEFGPFRSARR